MENFFYNDNFYSNLTEFCDYIDFDREEIESFPDDFIIVVELTNLEPIIKFDAEWIAGNVNIERYSENKDEEEYEKIVKILKENIDFEKINSLIPKLYYGNRKKHIFTKSDLLEAVS